jgi:hypothetical protein
MRKHFLFLGLAALLLISPSVSGQANEEFKPGGKIFGLLFTGFHSTFSGGDNTSSFEIRRSYLGFDYSFSQKFMSRILYDGMTETVDGKMMYTGYLRNAYIQFSDGKLMIKGGLIGSEQIAVTEKLWNYRYITKPFIDYSGMIYSADLGVMARVMAGERITFDVSVTNGRGYRNIEADGTYRFSAGASVIPWKNVILRGYYDMMGPSGNMQRTASIIGAWNGPRFSAGAEYIRQANNKMTGGYDYSGISIFTSLQLSEKISLFARYDDLSSVVPAGIAEPWNLAKDGSNFFLGVDYSPVRNVRLSPNFAGLIPDDPEASFAATVGLNVEARF